MAYTQYVGRYCISLFFLAVKHNTFFSYFWVGVLFVTLGNSNLLTLSYKSKSLKPLPVVLYRPLVESCSSRRWLITVRGKFSADEDKKDEYMILVFVSPSLAASSMLTMISVRLLYFMTVSIILTCYFRIMAKRLVSSLCSFSSLRTNWEI
jgi:hypothetical protein